MGQNDQTPSQLDVLNEQATELQNELQTVGQQITDVQSQIDKSTGDVETFKGQLATLQEAQTEKQNELTDVQNKIAALNTENAAPPVAAETPTVETTQAVATETTATTEATTTTENEASQITIADITEVADADVERLAKAFEGKGDLRHVLHSIKPHFPNLKTPELSSVLMDMQKNLAWHEDIVKAIENLPTQEA